MSAGGEKWGIRWFRSGFSPPGAVSPAEILMDPVSSEVKE